QARNASGFTGARKRNIQKRSCRLVLVLPIDSMVCARDSMGREGAGLCSSPACAGEASWAVDFFCVTAADGAVTAIPNGHTLSDLIAKSTASPPKSPTLTIHRKILALQRLNVVAFAGQTVRATALILLLAASTALAADAPETIDWSTRATGDWWGERQKLYEHGVDIQCSFIADGAKNLVNGLDTAGGVSRTLLDLRVYFDLKPIVGLDGGQVYFNFQTFQGKNT